ncbi:DNA-binding transcriptional ArsR family regulator [Mycetocola sp. BIGb0189]|uniref:ArsR/SmtB family transcription factor n=1 Tax=Mycetocola sp. BIGb0189 TaxID=2940604 RepID=UPI00216A83EF|nr:metalloregulator ArsR/SmtB family transcription factor [Mycetocola sp. BIGb0189]MCS4276537.1 DNA-binding transcriptional ArsR family regulator [Mycetocola sp. BIGb0189]
MSLTPLELQPLPRESGEDPATRAHALAPLMRALGDPNRLHLVLLLADGPLTVRELTDASGLSQTLVSHHLAPLRELDLVTVTPRGRANVYELCCEALATPVRLLANIAASTPEGREACCAVDTAS